MDFTKRDARAAAETAQFCHLRDQETGEYMMDGDTPIGAFVLGSSARSVHAALKASHRAKMHFPLRDANDEVDEMKMIEDMQADMVRSASAVTASFQGVQRGDADATASDAPWFYDLNMFSTKHLLKPNPKRWQKLSYAQQVMEFSNDNGKYLGNA